MDKKEKMRKYYLDVFSFEKKTIDRDDLDFLKSEVRELAYNRHTSVADALDLISGMLTYEFAHSDTRAETIKTFRALKNFSHFRNMITQKDVKTFFNSIDTDTLLKNIHAIIDDVDRRQNGRKRKNY